MSQPATEGKKPPPAPFTLGGALIPQRAASGSSPLIVATSTLNALMTKQTDGPTRRGANAMEAPPMYVAQSQSKPQSNGNGVAHPPSNSTSALDRAAAANPGAQARTSALRVDTAKPAVTPTPAPAAPLSALSSPMRSVLLTPVDFSTSTSGRAPGDDDEDDDVEPASEEEPESPPDEDMKKGDIGKTDHFEFLERKTRASVAFFAGGLAGLTTTANNKENALSPTHANGANGAAKPAASTGTAAAGTGPAPAGGAKAKSKEEMREMERTKLAEEIVSTEKTYVDGLSFLARHVLLRLRKSAELGRELVDVSALPKILLNVDELYDIHLQFYKALKTLEFERKLNSPELGGVFLKYVPFFKAYTKYVAPYSEASAGLRKLRGEKSEFDFFLTLQEKCENLRVEDYTILPVQRVPRYILLLKALIKCVDETDPAYAPLNKALDAVAKVASDINASVHAREAQLRVLDIQSHLTGDKVFELVSPTRIYIRNGPLFKFYNKKKTMASRKKYYFILFNDALLYTTVPDADGNFKGKNLLPLVKMELRDLPDTLEDKFMFEMIGSKKNLTVQAPSSADKYAWMTAIIECINKEKEHAAALKQRKKEK